MTDIGAERPVRSFHLYAWRVMAALVIAAGAAVVIFLALRSPRADTSLAKVPTGTVTPSQVIGACEQDGQQLLSAMAAYTSANPQAPLSVGGEAAKALLIPNYVQVWPVNSSHYSYSVQAGTGALQVTVGSVTSSDINATCATVS